MILDKILETIDSEMRKKLTIIAIVLGGLFLFAIYYFIMQVLKKS